MEHFQKGAEVISLFCRVNMNTRREMPVRASEMGLLIYLVKSTEPSTPLGVARFFRISKPMVTSMVRTLEHKRYLCKTPSPTDGRSVLLHPTQKAARLVEDTYEEYIRGVERLYSGLGPEKYEMLINLLAEASQIMLEEKKNG